jgi:N utilization substance protein A
VKLGLVIEELFEERGLDRTLLATIVCEGIKAAYEKKYPTVEFRVEYNKKSDELEVFAKKIVVTSVENEDTELSLRKARAINPDAEMGDEIWGPFEGKIGRIEIIRAKQVIANKIRTVESAVVFNEFKDKLGSIVLGVIHKCERGGVTIKLGDTLAFLPKASSIPTDKCVVGFSVRALLKEVLSEPRHDYQLFLDRASTEFVERLFELEIPEVYEKIVEIKKIVRIAGYKTKVAVVSHDKNIDPVGSLVGARGVRIQPILKELGGEKIDVIAWSDAKEKLIVDALKPAVISRVELVDDQSARVWLDEDQRSLAIGKNGFNIALASKLVGINIELVQAEKKDVDLSMQLLEG